MKVKAREKKGGRERRRKEEEEEKEDTDRKRVREIAVLINGSYLSSTH